MSTNRHTINLNCNVEAKGLLWRQITVTLPWEIICHRTGVSENSENVANIGTCMKTVTIGGLWLLKTHWCSICLENIDTRVWLAARADLLPWSAGAQFVTQLSSTAGVCDYLDRGAVRARKSYASPASQKDEWHAHAQLHVRIGLEGTNVAYAAIEIVVVHTYITHIHSWKFCDDNRNYSNWRTR